MQLLAVSATVATLALSAQARSVPGPSPLPCPPITDPVKPIEPPTDPIKPVEVPKVCSVLPPCLDGVMVPGVAYEVEPALYGCANKKGCDSMKIWCEPKDEKDLKKVHRPEDAFNFWYACEDMDAIPEETLCEVGGKNYTVGVAYEDVKYKGEKVDFLWCVSEDEVVVCSGDECGSTVELTPPGIEVDEDCIKPQPPKPRPDNCNSCEVCTSSGFKWTGAGCTDRCVPDTFCFSHPAQCDAPEPPKPRPDDCDSCEVCTRHGFKWTGAGCTAECVPDTFCFSNPAQCNIPEPPMPEPNPECIACVEAGNTFEWTQKECVPGCPRIATAVCATEINQCYPAPF